MEIYTVGIKGKFWPFFTNYLVRAHRIETNIKGVAIPPRLVLTLADDSQVIIGKIEEKTWKVYSDFIPVYEALEAKTWADASQAQKSPGEDSTNQSLPQQEPPTYQQQPQQPTTLQ